MIELVTPVTVDESNVERVELFSIDGKAYTVPDQVQPNLSLQYLYMARTQGLGIAESWLAERMLGTEGFLALINFNALTTEEYNKVVTLARAIAFGEVRPKELMKANGSGAASKTAPAKKRSATQKPDNG
jgi:hypothetical protein